MCASPVSYFRNSLVRLYRQRNLMYHFTCCTCEDLNSKEGGCYRTNSEEDTGSHLVQSLMDIVSSMINVSLVRDRVACNDVLISLGSELMGTVMFKANFESLELLQSYKIDAISSGSLLEIYSDNISTYMDMANFDGEMCMKHKHDAEKSMACRLWVYYNCKDGREAILRSPNLIKLRRMSTCDTLPA